MFFVYQITLTPVQYSYSCPIFGCLHYRPHVYPSPPLSRTFRSGVRCFDRRPHFTYGGAVQTNAILQTSQPHPQHGFSQRLRKKHFQVVVGGDEDTNSDRIVTWPSFSASWQSKPSGGSRSMDVRVNCFNSPRWFIQSFHSCRCKSSR